MGTDPKSGKNVYAKIGRYGAMIQIGESKSEEKPTFASLKKGQSIDSITLDEALGLFALPRVAGQKDGKDLTVSIGRFGPYVRFNGKFYSLAKTDDPYTVTAERCCEIIASKDAKDEQKKLLPRVIGEHDGKEVSANTGRFGPYIIFDGKNFKLPKGTDPMTVTLEEAVSAIDKPVKKK